MILTVLRFQFSCKHPSTQIKQNEKNARKLRHKAEKIQSTDTLQAWLSPFFYLRPSRICWWQKWKRLTSIERTHTEIHKLQWRYTNVNVLSIQTEKQSQHSVSAKMGVSWCFQPSQPQRMITCWKHTSQLFCPQVNCVQERSIKKSNLHSTQQYSFSR